MFRDDASQNQGGLPPEILLAIFSFLAPETIGQVRLVSRLFNQVMSDDAFWKAKVVLHFPRTFTKINSENTNWYSVFRKTYQETYQNLPAPIPRLFYALCEGDMETVEKLNVNWEELKRQAASDRQYRHLNGRIKWRKYRNMFFAAAQNQVVYDYFYQLYANNPLLIYPELKDSDVNPTLHMAISCFQPLWAIESLIPQGADINAKDNDGFTPLHIAAEAGYLEAVNLLISKDATVRNLSHDCSIPLTAATKNGHSQVVKLLLKSLPKPDEGSMFECRSALSIAVNNGLLDMVNILLDFGTDTGIDTTVVVSQEIPPLLIAAAKGYLNIIETLLAHGANVNIQVQNHHSIGQPTALYIAAEKGDLDVVNILLAHNANPNICTEGYPPGWTFRVEDLPEKRYEQMWHMSASITPLHAAVKNNHSEVVKSLLAHGANKNAALANGITPLHVAAQQGNILIVNVLLENGANIDNLARKSQTCSGDTRVTANATGTALHIAVAEGHVEVVRTLLAHDANTNLVNDNGKTPRDIARQNKNSAMLKLLVSDVSQLQIASGNSTQLPNKITLDMAIRNRDVNNINLLVDHRRNITANPHAIANLVNYILNRNADNAPEFKRVITFFKLKINCGFSKDQKVAAATALLKAIINGTDLSTLKQHKSALNTGELKPIYRSLLPSIPQGKELEVRRFNI